MLSIRSSMLALSVILAAAAAHDVKPGDSAGFHQWDVWLGAWRVTEAEDSA